MAPLKFEEKMKEKLEQRAIKPSEGSWQQLAKELDSQGQKKVSKKIWWYSVAAIFVGVLVVTSIIKSRGAFSEKIEDQFVDRSKEVMQQDKTDVVQEENTEQQIIDEKQGKVIENQVLTKKDVSSSAVQKNVVSRQNMLPLERSKSESILVDKITKEEKSNPQLVKNDNIIVIKQQEGVLPVNPEIIQDKVAGVVAQIKELQKNDVEVTDNEINRLLLEAQREIATQKILKSNTVSASALLQDVEEEIDETFKQRVFEALKTGFQKVKTAVAEREN